MLPVRRAVDARDPVAAGNDQLLSIRAEIDVADGLSAGGQDRLHPHPEKRRPEHVRNSRGALVASGLDCVPHGLLRVDRLGRQRPGGELPAPGPMRLAASVAALHERVDGDRRENRNQNERADRKPDQTPVALGGGGPLSLELPLRLVLRPRAPSARRARPRREHRGRSRSAGLPPRPPRHGRSALRRAA